MSGSSAVDHLHGTGSTATAGARAPFRKALYLDQPYDDNHVNEDFLAGMIKNAHVQPYDYWTCVREIGPLNQQISLLIVFAVAFKHVLENILPIDILITVDMVLLVVGYLLYYLFSPSFTVRGALRQIADILLITVLLFGLSPILRTLTSAFSDDTIWALVLLLSVVHVFTHDYAYVNAYSATFQATLSLNSVIFVSVLFASRLPSSLHSFAIISFCIELFAMFPIVRHHMKRWSSDLDIVLTWFLFCLTVAMLLPISTFLTLLYMCASGFMIFVVPSWLIYVQQYKDEIQGPWDEAEISIGART